jgi:recombination protein RecR
MLGETPSLLQFIRNLQSVPYLASKNLYRVVSHFLDMDQEKALHFCALLLKAKEQLVHCQTCFYWQEKDRDCAFCTSTKRDQKVVCVVEAWYDALAIEKTQGYQGVYHVLGGAICPLEGIGPEDLTIMPLIARIEQGIHEIILATNQTPEGEATAAFIASKLHGSSVVVSCLARGLPVGSSLGAMDRLTVFKALSERRPF